jgi:hypothetical protein
MYMYIVRAAQDNSCLPENSGGRNDIVELRVGGKVVLDVVVADWGIVNHHHHWSTHWRVRGSEFYSSAADVGSLDTGSAVGIK